MDDGTDHVSSRVLNTFLFHLYISEISTLIKVSTNLFPVNRKLYFSSFHMTFRHSIGVTNWESSQCLQKFKSLPVSYERMRLLQVEVTFVSFVVKVNVNTSWSSFPEYNLWKSVSMIKILDYLRRKEVVREVVNRSLEFS